MYSAPDFVKVSVKAADIFSGYSHVTGCPMDQFQQESYTIPCSPSDPNYTIVANTYIGLGWGSECYSTNNP